MIVLKTIEIKLNSKSIEDAINQLKQYQDSFDDKLVKLNQRLGDIGINIVRITMETVPDDAKGSYYTDYINENFGDKSKGCVIRLVGNKVLFAEFGAGIKYATPQHPQASQLGYGVGTYPNQTHAFNPKGWWYTDEKGESQHSYGNKPYLPMYKASLEMRIRIADIAREVFMNG